MRLRNCLRLARRWTARLRKALRLLPIACAALAIAVGGAVYGQEGQPYIETEQVISAAADCIAAYDEDDFEFEERRFADLGWQTAQLDGPLGDIADAYFHPDGIIAITLQTSCTLKLQMTSEDLTDLPTAMSAAWGAGSEAEADNAATWQIPDTRWSASLDPGPSDGSNVSVSVRRGFGT